MFRDRGLLLRGVALGAVMTAGFGLRAFAEEGAAPVVLDPVLVEAQAPKAPTVTTVDRETLDRRQVESIEDLGQRVDPSITYDRDTRSINIRGLSESRVRTTLDGIRLPHLVYGARDASGSGSAKRGGTDTFDFGGLSSLDIQKGADSSLFGSGALGGVLALRSLQPEDILTGDKVFGGLLKGGYSSADESWRGNLALAGRHGDTWFLAQGGYRRGNELASQGSVDTYGTTRTKADPADYDRYNAMITVHQYLAAGHRLGLTAEIFDREEDIDAHSLSGNTNFAPGDYRQTEESERQRVSLDYKFTAPAAGGWIDEAEAIAYWQKVKLTSFRDAERQTSPVGVFDQTNTNQVEAFGVVGNAVSRFDIGGIGNTLRYGGEFIADETRQFSDSVNNCPAFAIPFSTCYFLHDDQADAPDAEGKTVGLYIEDKITVAGGAVAVTPGLRYDWYEQKPQDNAAYQGNANYSGPIAGSSDSKLSPKVLLEWYPTDNVTLFAQWAQAFRAPSPTELYLTYGSVGSYQVIGNPDLKPETSNGYEVGASFGDEDLGGKITAYKNFYRNFIDEVDTGATANYPLGVTEYVNRAKVHIQGVELSGQWRFAPGWRTWASLAVQSGKDVDVGEHLNSIPPTKTILGLSYDAATWGVAGSATIASGREKVENPPMVRGFPQSVTHLQTPSYEVFDLTGWWEPGFLPGAKLEVGLFNVFDEKYRNAVGVPDTATQPDDFYSEPGRNFRVTATYRF
ncbi:TonB-dependent hemoglobin/transferrin/lactoferrin family receptor [Zavarzinia compransoris]|uniref:TonB-dependent hemoglobin/transferrin/lactoferrin family receptor n=1 Tax=Zavarzinia marina TaxID=2911065 RepID=UPI001F368463|nr:TonB-dependent hemoglobin/transferrin/lactoferrin family receptor [Zavarzinia marina]MCF4165861.1 TonB-dependent hemoglobin/transferrin/lactoferrin family receptor [Zavarzinia marina]